MVDAGLGNLAHGQPEMTSQWCHVAFVHAGVKVCARHRYESWWPRVKTQDLFLSRNECLLKRHFTDLCLSFPLSEKG